MKVKLRDASITGNLADDDARLVYDASAVKAFSEDISIIGRLRNCVSNLKHKHITYDFWWEDYCTETLNESGDDYEEPIILRQEIVNAKEISLGPYDEDVAFPWHGHSSNDFFRINEELQRLLPLIQSCKTRKDVIRLKRKHKEAYSAYFERPIQVLDEKDGQFRYSILRDGRHRIWAAKQTNGMLPIWVVQYRIVKKLDVEQFKKCCSYGEWRFYDNCK